VVVPDLKIFDLAIMRVQLFVRYLGQRNISFLCIVDYNSRRSFLTQRVKATLEFGQLFLKPAVVIARYRPGLFTNWRTHLSNLCFFTSNFKSNRAFPQLKSLNMFNKHGATKLAFPSVLISLDSFESLFLFSEAERLGLPIVGPSAIQLNNLFWTYTYPTLNYTAENILFFFRLFAINYLRGRLSFMVLNLHINLKKI
jgi:ribosomal protein S2